MPLPTRSERIVDFLPTLYYRDPLLRRLVESVAGRLAQVQEDAQEVMTAHWVDSADRPPIGERAFLRDLPRIAAIVPLVPFEDETTAQPLRETLLLDPAALLTGPGGQPLAFEELAPGQRLFAGGNRLEDGTLLATRVSLVVPLPEGSVFEAIEGRLLDSRPASLPRAPHTRKCRN